MIDYFPEESDWKEAVNKIMECYVDKLDGSYIDVKENTIVFDWQEADAEFGHRISDQLIKDVDILKQKGLKIEK